MGDIVWRTHTEFHTHLSYGADGDEAELDALGVFDSVLFIVEAKGGTLRPAARAAKRRAFEDQIDGLIRAPHEQALRAERFLKAEHQPTFRTKGGSVTIDMSTVSRVFLVSVLLESLGHITANIVADSRFGASPVRPAWTVSLIDLLPIADCLEGYAAWFPAYLLRRERIAKQKVVQTGDELDFFMLFLTRGLYMNKADFKGAD